MASPKILASFRNFLFWVRVGLTAMNGWRGWATPYPRSFPKYAAGFPLSFHDANTRSMAFPTTQDQLLSIDSPSARSFSISAAGIDTDSLIFRFLSLMARKFPL